MKKILTVLLFLLLGSGLFVRPVFAQTTLPPTDKIDTLTYLLYNGKLREMVTKGNMVWWRDSSDTTEKNLTSAWTSKFLSEAWGANVSPAGHPLPAGDLDAHSYQQFPNCGTYGNRITEVVIKGGELWYRRSSDITGANIGSVPFAYKTLVENWGTSGPPTDSIDAVNYDIYDGSPRELILKGGNVWVRTLSCSTSQWSNWSVVSLTSAWGANLNHPPLVGVEVYATDYAATDKTIEIVVQGGTAWSRRSSDTNSHHSTDVWRPTPLSSFWQRNHMETNVSDIARHEIDVYLSVYGNTDFSRIINEPYTDKVLSTNNFRGLIANALAYEIKYYDNNFSPEYLAKAKSLINTTVDRYPYWGKFYHISGIPARDLLLASWLIWDKFTDAEKTKIKNVAIEEANYWDSQLQEAREGGAFLSQMNGWQDDTKAETNAAYAQMLSFAANMFPDESLAKTWEEGSRCFAFHTVTTSASAAVSRGDSSTACGITTQTVYDDFTLDNHGYHPSPLYTLAAIAGLSQGSLGYYLNGKIIPSEFKHNISPLWRNFLTYFHPGDYTILRQYFRGQDWGDIDIWLAATDINYLSAIDNNSTLSDTSATALSSDMMHYLYSFKGRELRVPVTPPITQMEVSSQTTTNWFLNGLTHAKGAAEIVLYSNPQLFFCRGKVDVRGKSSHLCDTSVPVKPFYTQTLGDLNNDGRVDIFDLQLLLNAFTNIFDYNKLVANYGK